jgi:nucleoid-associated protein YgaU
MTSDAKIGLLLGLVFIFIIAFAINGLPRFRSNSNELTTNMVSSPDTLGIGGNERKAQEVFNWTEQVNQEPLEEIQTPIEEKENVRFTMQLPEDISIAKDTSVMEITDEVEPILAESTGPILTESVQPILTESVEPPAPEPVTEEIIEVRKPEPVRPASPKIYTVSDGDTLADIAKKFYGQEEGNKRANVAKIFEANRQLLKAIDEIYVGQKLLIPPLGSSGPEKNTTESSFSSILFEKVKSIGRKNPSTDTRQTKPSREYIVREGDNLWRIAAKQLGDGSRYTEISKVNADILEDQNTLVVGMHLRIPAR